MSNRVYRHIRVSGGPHERGRQYGEQAGDLIGGSIEAYTAVFEFYAAMAWQDACAQAERFIEPIEAYEASYLEEMRGIAAGAGVGLSDILALNLRSEIMFAQRAESAGLDAASRDGCSSVAVLPRASGNGHTLLGQNWDWLIHARQTTVVLEAEQDDGPNYVTVVEAGLLAKTGMNTAGLGLVTNTLVSDRDVGEVGVPYHVCLRSLLDASSIVDALARLQRATRSSSANYLLAHADGLAVDVEGTPGDCANLLLEGPREGVITHTNHFVSPRFADCDTGLGLMPDSFFRLQRLDDTVRGADAKVTSDLLRQAFSDHAGHPFGVCSHPDPAAPLVDQAATIASLVMDLDERRLWLSDGNPCETPYRELDLADLLADRRL